MSEDTTALAKMDLQARLRDKVREELGKLVPDDVLDKFIAQAWKDLVEVSHDRCQFGHAAAPETWRKGKCVGEHALTTREPELYQMIKAELREHLEARVKAWAAAAAGRGDLDDMARSALEAASAAAGQAFLEQVRKEAVARALTAMGASACPNGHVAAHNTNCSTCGMWTS